MEKVNLKFFITIVAIVISSNLAFGQGNNWKIDGNNISNNKNFLGTTNFKDLQVITNDSTRMVITKEGDVNIVGSSDFNVNKTITADSIHVRTIKIGNNSLWIGGTPQSGSDNIQSNNGQICFGNSGFPFSNIKVGIGTTTPNNTIQVKDLINFDDNNWATYIGNLSGNVNTSGFSNTFVGANSGLSNTTGIFNTFLGENAGLSNILFPILQATQSVFRHRNT